MTTLFVTGLHACSSGGKRTYVYDATYHREADRIVWQARVRPLDGRTEPEHLSGCVGGTGVPQCAWRDDVKDSIEERIDRLSAIEECV